jgi:hypothetical protein
MQHLLMDVIVDDHNGPFGKTSGILLLQNTSTLAGPSRSIGSDGDTIWQST